MNVEEVQEYELAQAMGPQLGLQLDLDPSAVIVGNQVMYVMELGSNKGKSRPAFVVEKWGDGDMVNLQVLTDANNEIDPLDKRSYSLGNGMCWVTSVHYSKEHKPRTWHWLGE